MKYRHAGQGSERGDAMPVDADRREWRGLLALCVAVALVLVTAACSTDGGEASSNNSSDLSQSEVTAKDAGRAAARPASCDQEPTVDEVEAVPVDGVPSDLTLTSFDGTALRLHWFPLQGSGEEPVPVVMVGPGWSMPGATGDGVDVIGLSSSPIDGLHQAGFNVLTWDPRGFGESGGAASVNDPELEGRDAQVLLDWLATRPEVTQDRDGDPRVGMLGGSYGGGIQLVLAGLDCRVDAIVPTIAWNSLLTSLYPNDTVKTGWSGVLTQTVGTFNGNVDPHVTTAATEGGTVGTLDPEVVEWFASKGPADLVSKVTVPTLIVHGTADTLFTPTEAVANYRALSEAGTAVAMLWGCGGHGICLTPGDDQAYRDRRSIAWLDRYLTGAEVEVGPTIDLLDQEGVRWVGEEFPEEPDNLLTARSDGGSLALSADSVAGPVAAPDNADVLGGIAAPITPARANQAVEVTLEADEDALVLGAPRVTFTYAGTSPDGERPTRAFLQVVDDRTGLVIGNQITPVELVLDGTRHTAEVDLEVVIHHLRAGSSVTLQLVATTPAFATPRLGGQLDVSELELALPTTTSLEPADS